MVLKLTETQNVQADGVSSMTNIQYVDYDTTMNFDLSNIVLLWKLEIGFSCSSDVFLYGYFWIDTSLDRFRQISH